MKADRTKSGIIFNIQKFSVNDGPGIRTTVFFKGCPLRCRWCANPESQSADTQILFDAGKCLHCGRCVNVCPSHAVSRDNGRTIVDHSLCRGCGRCVPECPGKALSAEGERKTVQEIIDIVMQDIVFYEESGGGITLSGGEFLSQKEFAAELLKAAKEEGLHTCCETTGYASPEVFREITRDIDLILIDMKHWNSEKHREGTGVTDDLPYRNLCEAVSAGRNVLVRIPVIPGYNDSRSDAERFSARLKEAGVNRVQLLPFHQFGENKYDLLNRTYAYKDIDALHKEDLSDYLQVFRDSGLDAFF